MVWCAVYEGDILDDLVQLRHGQGRMVYANGDIYDGNLTFMSFIIEEYKFLKFTLYIQVGGTNTARKARERCCTPPAASTRVT